MTRGLCLEIVRIRVSTEGKMQAREWNGAGGSLHLRCVEHRVSTTQVKLFKIGIKTHIKSYPMIEGV